MNDIDIKTTEIPKELQEITNNTNFFEYNSKMGPYKISQEQT